MGNVIQLQQDQAATMTTCNELVKMYRKRDPVKFEEAIRKNEARYESLMDEILGRS